MTERFDETSIATFSCNDIIFVYEKNCGWLPMSPCKLHRSVEEAKEHLKKRGVLEPTIVTKTKNDTNYA